MLTTVSDKYFKKYYKLDIECLTREEESESWVGETRDGLFIEVRYDSDGLLIRSAETLNDMLPCNEGKVKYELVAINTEQFLYKKPNIQIGIDEIIDHMKWKIDANNIWDK